MKFDASLTEFSAASLVSTLNTYKNIITSNVFNFSGCISTHFILIS